MLDKSNQLLLVRDLNGGQAHSERSINVNSVIFITNGQASTGHSRPKKTDAVLEKHRGESV